MVVTVIAQVQLVDAARDGARAIARGDDEASRRRPMPRGWRPTEPTSRSPRAQGVVTVTVEVGGRGARLAARAAAGGAPRVAVRRCERTRRMSARRRRAADGEPGSPPSWRWRGSSSSRRSAWVGMLAAAATARQHQVDGAADLVAVSAAARLQRGRRRLRVARATSRRAMTCRCVSCRVDGDDVVVGSRRRDELRLRDRRQLAGQARAGPEP